MSRKALLALSTALALAGPAARADWPLFLPRALDSGATLELYGAYESDDYGFGVRRAEWRDEFLKEKLSLTSRGYSYHPRFLQYQLSFGGALSQERYRRSAASDAEWQDGEGYEYAAHVYLLPEHPYTFELFALRFEPLFRDRSATERNHVAESRGADFRYRRKPWFLHSRVTDDRRESDLTSSEVQRLDLDGEYFKRWASGNQLAFTGRFSPSTFSDSFGLEGETRLASAGNRIDLRRVRLSTDLGYDTFEQERGDDRFESEQRSLYQRLTLLLPWSFRSEISYRWHDDENRFTDRERALVRDLATESRDLQLDLIHKLYESLGSNYTFRRSERQSLGGESLAEAHGLAFNYGKRIPRGRLNLGWNVGRSEVENVGRSDVAAEPHPAVPVPGTFVLARTDADRATLAVFVRSPFAPFESVLLAEGAHYAVTELGNSIEVSVFGLPPQFVLPGTFDFTASYSLLAGEFLLRTDTLGYSVSLQLLDDLLTPYYSYGEVSSEVLEGAFTGSGLDSKTHVAGVHLQHGAWRARFEAQDVDWDVEPYRVWKAEVQYLGTLSPTTSLQTTIAYADRSFPEGRDGIPEDDAAERRESIAANLNQRLFSRTLLLSVGGSLSRTRGWFESEASAANASLSWKVGKLDLSAGASQYASESVGTTLQRIERTHRYYFFRVHRMFY